MPYPPHLGQASSEIIREPSSCMTSWIEVASRRYNTGINKSKIIVILKTSKFSFWPINAIRI
jgi:hypothetical protein